MLNFFKKIPLNVYIKYILIFSFIGILIFKTSLYFQEVQIIKPETELYQKPGMEYKTIKELPLNTRGTVLDRKYHWVKIRTENEDYGWVPDWTLAQKDRNQITSLKDATIVIDPGHGGSDSGALSQTNKMEKHYTLKYGLELAKKLRAKGAKVYMSRDTDTFVKLSMIPRVAEKNHADAFISIHFDAAPDADTASGITTYYYHKKTSYRLAKCINKTFSVLPLENRGIDFGDFLVIRENTQPAVLLEMGYINSTRDFKAITSSKYRNTVTNDIVKGLEKYFKK